jgi:hypothetical protein
VPDGPAVVATNQFDELISVKCSTAPSERVNVPSVVPWPLTELIVIPAATV